MKPAKIAALVSCVMLIALAAACNGPGSAGEGIAPLASQTSAPGTPLATPVTPPATEPVVPPETASPTGIPAGEVTTAPEAIQDTDALPWWNDTVFYEVFIRSFQDSDGDGIGDLNGLIQRLDYLNDGDPDTNDDLGITGIWLMPVMESPSYHGYDVVDYFKVDEEYGTEEDFRRLIDEAHARDIKVIVDLVMNHTSSDHPWFQESMDPDSGYRDWYIWSTENPGYRGPDGQRVWHPADGGYYYALFWDGMPDLNLENPEVTAALDEAASFWLEEMGVDGFRLDAIKHLVEAGPVQENTPATHAWLEDFHDFYKEVDPQAFTVGEAWTRTGQVVDYTGDEVDVAFQFDLALQILNASQVGIGSLAQKSLAEVVESFPPGQYATFLANHDQNRVLSQLEGDESAAKVAASILLTSPGVPFIYYGEEIGMVGEKPDEDIRRPMQWTAAEPGAGFTDGLPWRPPDADYPERNVAAQDGDPDSLLNHYRALIRLRNEHSALLNGEWASVDAPPGILYAALRYDDTGTFLVLINPSRREVTDYSLSLASGPLTPGIAATLVFGQGEVSAPEVNDSGGFDEYVPLPALPPQSTFIINLSSP